MQGICEKDDCESLPTGVFELPGEPAVVINGVPDIPASDGNVVSNLSSLDGNSRSGKLSYTMTDTEKPRNTGFGEWLEGREVQKLFGERYYSGTVTEYDQETGWYRVVYEDGDFEDLEWHELQEVLQPLDITLPLKSLALKMIRKNQKTDHGSGRKAVVERQHGAKAGGRRGRPIRHRKR